MGNPRCEGVRVLEKRVAKWRQRAQLLALADQSLILGDIRRRRPPRGYIDRVIVTSTKN
jgi:hypothetical protein